MQPEAHRPSLSSRIRMPDGRILCYARFGDGTGLPVVYAHGFPASRLEAELLHPAALATGFSVIAPDRPGMGCSDFAPNRTILDWADDVAFLADRLGLDRFRLLGGSAGCPYALATAHRLGDRIVRVALVAGLAPVHQPHSATEMGGAARFAFLLARNHPRLLELVYGSLARIIARYPALVYRLNRATEPDKVVLARPEIRAVLDASVAEALRPGVSGALHDLALLAGSWGFDLADIRVPVELWHGREDGVVPCAMGERLAASIPMARLHLLAREGHVSLVLARGMQILNAIR